MANAPVVAIGITFRDRDGNRAKATCYCAFALPVADVWTLAFRIAARMQAISSALLYKIDLTWRYTVDSPPDPALDSTTERKILLLITNADEEINGLVLPSPAENWEVLGNYAGIRLDLASAGAVAFAAMLLTADLRTEDNRAFGTTLVAGGLEL